MTDSPLRVAVNQIKARVGAFNRRWGLGVFLPTIVLAMAILKYWPRPGALLVVFVLGPLWIGIFVRYLYIAGIQVNAMNLTCTSCGHLLDTTTLKAVDRSGRCPWCNAHIA